LIKNDADKINKVKQNNNKVKDVRAKKLPSQQSSTSSPATALEKLLLGAW
jgi:hypothetical protein